MVQNKRIRKLRWMFEQLIGVEEYFKKCYFCDKKITLDDIAKEVKITIHHLNYSGKPNTTVMCHCKCHKKYHAKKCWQEKNGFADRKRNQVTQET